MAANNTLLCGLPNCSLRLGKHGYERVTLRPTYEH